MAKRIVDEEMRFSIIINGNEAQAELYKLEKSTRDLTATNKDLRAEKSRLAAQGKKNSKEYKDLTAEIKKNNATITANKSRMGELQKQIGITGLTMRQLKNRASQLRLQLNNMVPGSAEYIRFNTELKKVNAQITKLSLNGRAAESSLSRLGNRFNKYAALGAAAIATGTGIVLSLQEMIDYNGKLADAQSDVIKTTSLTNKEVRELTKEFGLMNTRTSRIELLKLAEEAGRLGIEGKKNIQDFVKVSNELKVALGDDLSTEQIREVGKITELYGVAAKMNRSFAESYQSVASAINEVSASGSNQASYLVDYVKRTAGSAKAANISAAANIGYAATFDELGQSVEISGTAMNKLLFDMAKNSKEYAKVAGMSEKNFKALIESDANEAMLKFLEGLNGNDDGIIQLSNRLDKLGVDGARSSQALSVLSGATDKVRKKQELSAIAMYDNISVTNEYGEKNNNLAATLAKVGRKLRGLYANATISEGLNNFLTWFGKFIGAVEDSDGSVTKWRNRLMAALKVIVIFTAAIFSYNTAVKLSALLTNRAWQATKLFEIVQKVSTVTTATYKSVLLLLKAAYFATTGQITRARAALVLFNRTMLLSPLGLIVAGITAVVGAYYLFAKSSEEAVTSQKLLADAQKDAIKNTAEDRKQKELWLKVAQDEKQSLENRQKAIDKLNETVPEYNNQLNIETANTKAATKALDDHIEKMKQSAIAYALEERIKKKAVELANIENSSIEDNIEWYDKLWSAIKSGGNSMNYATDQIKTSVKNRNASIAATKEEIAVLEELYKQQLKQNSDNGISINTGDAPTGSPTSTNPTDGDLNRARKIIDERKKAAEELLQIERKTQDNRLSQIEDSFQREMAINEESHRRKISDLKSEAAEFLKESDKAYNDKDSTLGDILKNKYLEIYDQIETEEALHQDRRSEILEDGIQDYISKLQEEHESEAVQRQIAHNEALAALGSNEEARKALQEKFDKDELERKKKLQQDLIAEMKGILNTAEFEGFDISILSDEELQAIKQRLQDLGYSLSEVNAILAKMQGNASADELAGIGIDAGSRVDILGMDDEQWSKLFERTETLAGAIGKVGQIVGAATQAYAMYDQFASASEQKKLDKFIRNADKEKNKQKRLLDSKLISKKQHDDAVAAIEKETAKKKAEMEHKQAKRQKAINIAGIISNTAVAVSKALAQGGLVLGVPWAAIVGAMGAVQLALAVAQPLPAKGYEKGLYNKMPVRREQDGKMFNADFGGYSRSGVVNTPTVFLTGEAGPEMIIDNRTLRQLDPQLTNSLYRELGRVRGFENGLYKPRETSDDEQSRDDEMMMMVLKALNRNSEIMERLEANGVFINKGMSNIKNLRDEFDRLKKIENKAQIKS